MGAWRGSDFTSGHVLSLGLAQSPVHAVNVNEVKRDAISCTEIQELNSLKSSTDVQALGFDFLSAQSSMRRGSKPNISDDEIPSHRYSST